MDLDETLYLRNSTEDFIGSAWPAPLAFLLVKLLDLLKPVALHQLASRRATSGASPASASCCRGRFRHGATPRSGWAGNRRTVDRSLRCAPADSPLAIVTLGFLPIVRPLVAAMGLGGYPAGGHELLGVQGPACKASVRSW